MKSSPESIPTLKQLIEYANTTQRELSKRTGIAEVTINSWVAKKKIPRLDNALVLCRELGVSLKTLSQSLGLDTTGIPDDSPN
jgi:transcriptional regulator with XRE-family HTH domain